MKTFRFCDRCGRPWARHVPRCPGCGRPRPCIHRAIAMAGAAAMLAALWWR